MRNAKSQPPQAPPMPQEEMDPDFYFDDPDWSPPTEPTAPSAPQPPTKKPGKH